MRSNHWFTCLGVKPNSIAISNFLASVGYAYTALLYNQLIMTCVMIGLSDSGPSVFRITEKT